MTQAQLIAEMLATAKPIVRAYHGDLFHDARLLADAEPGAIFFWTPRENGSYVVTLRRGDRFNREAATCWEAFNNPVISGGQGLRWHRLAIEAGDRCSIVEMTREQADSAIDVIRATALNAINDQRGLTFAEINM